MDLEKLDKDKLKKSSEKAIEFNKDKAKLFNSFIISLIKNILNTYLGDEVTKGDDRDKHFEWCWNKSLEDASTKKFKVNKTGKHKDYFKKHFFYVYYSVDNKNISNDNKILKFWLRHLDFENLNKNKEILEYVKIYKLIDDNSKFRD